MPDTEKVFNIIGWMKKQYVKGYMEYTHRIIKWDSKESELVKKKFVEDIVLEEQWILTDDSVTAQYVFLF